MRIVSLLPSATDIVVALGAENELVGVSHSCGSRWSHLPRLTSTRIDTKADSASIDRQVKSADEPLYDLDIETLECLSPDVIVSQSLCDVCAVPSGDVEEAVRQLPCKPALVNLSPFRLGDIPKGIADVGEAIGRRAKAIEVVGRWEADLARLRGRASRPWRIAFLDWLDPPFAAGHWVPDIVNLLGCESVLAKPGEPSHEIAWDDVRAAGPDLVIAACCGLTAARAAHDPAPQDFALHLLDGYEHFSRPGLCLVHSAEILAELIERQLQPPSSGFRN